MDGGRVVIRTIWIAGLCLLMIAGLLATKVVSAAVSASSESQFDATASLERIPIPGIDTLTEADRNAAMPLANTDDAGGLPILSTVVRPTTETFRAGSTHRVRPAGRAKAAAHARSKSGSEPAKMAVAPCRQLDPIARFLASANLAPRCQG